MSAAGSGYLHPAYAESFDELGRPRELAACGGWCLERKVPRAGVLDGMGCYPLFCCRDWRALAADLDELERQLVTFTVVTDPFGEFTLDDLRRTFDIVRPHKRHYVTDVLAADRVPGTRRHRRNLAAANRS